MRISNVKLNAQMIAGNAEGIGLLIGMTAGFDYIDGKKTDNQSHVKYEIVFFENLYQREIVKVPGTKPVVTPEQLEQQKGKIKVKFKNLSGKFYRTNSGEYALSASADGVEVIA